MATQEIESYTELIELACHTRQSFQRQVTTAVYHVDRGVLVVAILQDTYHDMRMALLIDPDSQEILDIRAVMLRYPYSVCLEAPDAYRRLIGLKIFQPGTMKRIHGILPRRDGCTHLYSVLEACLRALFIGGRKRDTLYDDGHKDLTDEQRRQRSMQHPMLKNTCISFSKPPMEEAVAPKP